MRPPRTIARHSRAWAAVVVVVVSGALLAFQPLGSPWWSGYDYDSVYVGSGLQLFRGDRSVFYDHPGAPLQEVLAATFSGAWAVSSPGESRAAKEDWWLRNLDRTRPYLRVVGSLLYVLSALIVFWTLAWVLRGAWWGLLGALLFLGSPDVVTWASVVKPDPLLAALAVLVVALTVEGFRRRSGGLYLAAAFALGYDVSVKVQAAGLVVPLVLAVALRPPPAGWWTLFRAEADAWLRAHRRLLGVVFGVWLALFAVLNALAAPPAAKPLAELVALVVALAFVSMVVWLAVRRTRIAAFTATAIGSAFAAIAGLVLPNAFYLSVPGPMVRQVAITLTGGGVNAGAHPAVGAWGVLGPWHLLILVAAVGLVKSLLDRDLTGVVWASGAAAMGLLAYLRYGEIHYYTAAIALAVPLVLLALRSVPAFRALVAAFVVAVVLYQPYKAEIDQARSRGQIADSTVAVNRWVANRLGPHQVALTSLEASDARYFHLVHFYTPTGPVLDYRFLPPDTQAAQYIQQHHARVRYVIGASDEDATAVLRSLGLPGLAHRVSAPGFVYAVT